MIFIVLTISADFGYGQRSTKKRKRPDPDRVETKFVDNLWYGGGFGLGFYGGNISGVQSQQFFISVSPMVGYKVTDFLSFGPRLEIGYLNARYDDNVEIYKSNSLNYGIGVFSRAKFLNVLFGHIEYSYLNQEVTTGIANRELITRREDDTQFLIGLGYHSGYPFGSEISILYDLQAPEDTVDLPIILRFGFNYKF